MSRFLRIQNKLKLFSSNLKSSALHGCLTFDSISQNALSINDMNLQNHFHFFLKRDSKVIYIYLKKFSNLSTLPVDYEDLGEELLLSLANNCQKTLNSISIRIRINDRIFEYVDVSAISSDDCLHIKKLIPELKVKIRLDVASVNGDLVKQILPSTVPEPELDVYDKYPIAAKHVK